MKQSKLIIPIVMLGFLLGIHNGRVALWKEPDPEPRKVFPYPVTMLPQDIQQALQEGIYIESETDLERLLENFGS